MLESIKPLSLFVGATLSSTSDTENAKLVSITIINEHDEIFHAENPKGIEEYLGMDGNGEKGVKDLNLTLDCLIKNEDVVYVRGSYGEILIELKKWLGSQGPANLVISKNHLHSLIAIKELIPVPDILPTNISSNITELLELPFTHNELSTKQTSYSPNHIHPIIQHLNLSIQESSLVSALNVKLISLEIPIQNA